MTGPALFTISEVARANGAEVQTAAIQLHALAYNWTLVMQLANTRHYSNQLHQAFTP